MTSSGSTDLRVSVAQVEAAQLEIELRQSLGEPVDDRLQRIAAATPSAQQNQQPSSVDDFPVDSWVQDPRWGTGIVMRHRGDRLVVLFEAFGYKLIAPGPEITPATAPQGEVLHVLPAQAKSSFRFFAGSGSLRDADFLTGPEGPYQVWMTHPGDRFEHEEVLGDAILKYRRGPGVSTEKWLGVVSVHGAVDGVFVLPAEVVDDQRTVGDPADQSPNK